MNKFSSVLLALSLMSTASLTYAMDPMEKHGAMEKDAMTKDAMKKEPMAKEGAMMKAEPKKMKKQNDKMEHGGSMTMEPKK
jgi:pentapeptide MXKDX repeat protein